jgi:hypothetical protein
MGNIEERARRWLRRNLLITFLCFGFLILTGCAHIGGNKQSVESAIANIGIPEDLLSELSPVYTNKPCGFLLRPPRGYTYAEEEKASLGGVVHQYVWIGLRRSDDTFPQLLLMVTNRKRGEDTHSTEVMLQEWIAYQKWRYEDWKCGAVNATQIGGLNFLRVDWAGLDIASNLRKHGFLYIAFDNVMVFQISSNDFDPYHEQSLRLTEAAVSTFKRWPFTPIPIPRSRRETAVDR